MEVCSQLYQPGFPGALQPCGCQLWMGGELHPWPGSPGSVLQYGSQLSKRGHGFPGLAPQELSGHGLPAMEQWNAAYMVWHPRAWAALLRPVMVEGVAAYPG